MTLIHPSSELQLQSVLNRPVHSLIIEGEVGSGRKYITRILVERFTNKKTVLKNDSDVIFVDAKQQGQGIDSLRTLKRENFHKNTGKGMIKKFIVIANADNLKLEAQNSILKLLEEPKSGLMIIMTTHKKHSLLPTIISRCGLITLKPIDRDAARNYFKDRFDESKYLISEGKAGVLLTLINNTDYPLLRNVEDAKKILKSTKYDRFLQVTKLMDDKEYDIYNLFWAINRIIDIKLRNSMNKTDPSLKHISAFVDDQLITEAIESKLSRNVSKKLVLSRLCYCF